MTACDQFRPCTNPKHRECDRCGTCDALQADHQTARPAGSDGQPGPSGAPDVAQGAPLQNEACEMFEPGHRGDLCAACSEPESDHQTPQSDPVAGVTEGSAVDAEGPTPLAPAPAAPDLHGACAAPAGAAVDRYCSAGCGCRWGTDDADRFDCGCDGDCCFHPDFEDRPDQDNAPLVGAPHASPVDPPVPHEPTGLATWDRAIELSGHVGRLSMALELILDDADPFAISATLQDLARDAIAKAREATS